ncbi:MAG: carbohydrate-binding domain-containing protein [archaeon]
MSEEVIKIKMIDDIPVGPDYKKEKRGHLWDYVFAFIIIALLVTLVVAVKNKPTEGFTELYFEDHTNLPKYSDGNLEFSYSIHNLENKDYTYYVEIAVERDNGTKEVLNTEKYEVKHNETKTVEEKINVQDFKKAKVIVSLKDKEQSIHFWTAYAKEILKYEGLGTGILDCLDKTIKIQPTNKFVISAKGEYIGGWPEMVVYVDGKKVLTETVANDQYVAIPVSYEFSKGVHYIDIMFTNDLYNSKTKADRNLYIENIWISNKYISPKNGVLEKGTGVKALDCEESLPGDHLYSGGTLRFKVEAI